MACIKPGIDSVMLSWAACECSQHLAAALGMPREQALHADIQLCGYVLQEAAKLYQRATSADPNNERTWLQLGLLERRRGQAAAARECFRRGVQAAPHNPYMYQAGTAPCVCISTTGSGSAWRSMGTCRTLCGRQSQPGTPCNAEPAHLDSFLQDHKRSIRAAQQLISDAVHVMHRLACTKHALGDSSMRD